MRNYLIIATQFVIIVVGVVYGGILYQRISRLEHDTITELNRLQSQMTMIEKMQYNMLKSTVAGN